MYVDTDVNILLDTYVCISLSRDLSLSLSLSFSLWLSLALRKAKIVFEGQGPPLSL